MEANAAHNLTQERWQEIKGIFQAAVEIDPSEQDAFLEQACSGDEALRIRVKSLLSSDEQEWELLETPAFEAVAGLFAEDRPALSIGHNLGHYKVLDLLGTGGMGEVYLAEDQRLGRKIALKLLPADFSTDQLRMHRFQQEARAASALNHPNIITIHEIGEFEDRHFIATEFIEGRTLRQLMKRRKLTLPKAIDIAIQAASALAAAHEVGVVHRDIKPENIMLRPDGYVKLLDFGLAQLNHPQSPTTDTESLTVDNVDTAPGVLMGTVNYMSPEQTRGQRLDARSDIFSLGMVIYETIAGCPPFEGKTTSDLIAAILKVEPLPLTQYVPDAPPELQRIVSKALRKDREERYQTIKDMLVDLRSAKKELEQSGTTANTADGAETAINTVGRLNVNVTSGQSGIHASSSAQYIFSELKRHRTGSAVALAVLIVGAVATVFALLGSFNQKPSRTLYLNTRLTRITNDGKSHSATISPDGKYVAYLTREGGGQNLWINWVASGSKVPIGLLTRSYYYGPTFSPDGNYLYYVSKEDSDTEPTLYRIPTLGGLAQKVISGVDSAVSVSSDGKRLAFVRNYPGETSVIVANVDGTTEQKLASRQDPEYFWSAAWSPDGTKLACAGMRRDSQGLDAKLIEVELTSGIERTITVQGWRWIDQVRWLQDGSGLIVIAADKEASAIQLWLLSYPGADARRITTDLNNYANLSLTSDSSALVTTHNAQLMNLWVTPSGDSGSARQITSGSDKRDGMYGISWTADGQIIYSSSAGGSQEIWRMESDGSNQKQLTIDSSQRHSLSASPDGRYIVYVSDRAGYMNVWRVNIDGSNPIQLTHGTGELGPYCSADSKWVFYHVLESGKRITWKVPIDGGDPVQVTNAPPEMLGVSPDGKLMIYLDSGDQTKKRVGILAIDGDQPVKFLDLPSSAWRIQWGPDGRALTYVDWHKGVQNIWNQPLDGGPPSQMTDFKGGGIAFFAWSRDGKKVAIAGRQTSSDVVLISEVK
ncbi:MAG: LpqB family beta-propeller domain-containing protein [Acidobacteriota bacterium]